MTTQRTLIAARFAIVFAMTGLVIALFAALAARAPMARAADAAEGGAKVSIANFDFAPGEITIAPGESVTWTNDDGSPHGVKYGDGAPGNDYMLPGAAFTRRFDTAGTFDYACPIHPYMTGRVVVRRAQ
jgi:plastocyanin